MLRSGFLKKAASLLIAGAMLTTLSFAPAAAAEGKSFKLAWSIYTGYMPRAVRAPSVSSRVLYL